MPRKATQRATKAAAAPTSEAPPTPTLPDHLAAYSDLIPAVATDTGIPTAQVQAVIGALHNHNRIHPDASPWFTQHPDGHIEQHWPENVQIALVARELVTNWTNTWSRAEQLRIATLNAGHHHTCASVNLDGTPCDCPHQYATPTQILDVSDPQ